MSQSLSEMFGCGDLPDDHGKTRVYDCPCGGQCHRPLSPRHCYDSTAHYPKPCDSCGRSLDDIPFRIEDSLILVREMLAKAKKTP